MVTKRREKEALANHKKAAMLYQQGKNTWKEALPTLVVAYTIFFVAALYIALV